MPFTVADFHDLVRLLEERPEWRSEMRRLVLSDEYLTLPEQVAELRQEVAELRQEVAELRQEVVELRQEVAELRREITELRLDTDRRFARVDQQFKEVRTDLAQLKGENLERRYSERAHSYFGRLIRRLKVVSREELAGLLEDAVDRGVLSAKDCDEVGWADLIVRGRWRADDRQVMVLAEISWVVDRNDVLRATDRAKLLARLGTPVVPVVAGTSVTERAADLARIRGTWQMLNGRIVEPAGHASGDS